MAQEVPDASVTIFTPPPVRGLGTTGGFKFIVEDRGDLGLVALQDESTNLIRAGNTLAQYQLTRGALAALGKAKVPETVLEKLNPLVRQGFATHDRELFVAELAHYLDPAEIKSYQNVIADKSAVPAGLTRLLTVYRANSPQLFVDVNRDQCQMLGVPINDVYDALNIYLGSLYVNDFNLFGRTWQVIIQCESDYRDQVADVKRLKVRNNKGGMVPLGSLAQVKEVNGPLILTRYNMYPAVAINGDTLPGVSSGDGIKLMEDLAERKLPHDMTYEWTEIAYMQIIAGNTAWKIFALAVLGAFLVLAALYESWSLPLAVILVVPVCLVGSITGVAVTHSDINIFTQVGFVVLIGLASKNAILIVEFAKNRRAEGMPRRQATLSACELRFRPIMMTSFAFILGVVPLLIAVGAGAEMRRVLGTAVFSGMLGVTFFGILLTPVFFNVINRLSESTVFASRTMRLASLVIFWTFVLLTLGLAWLLPLLMQAFTPKSRRHRVVPPLLREMLTPPPDDHITARPPHGLDHQPPHGEVPPESRREIENSPGL